jgi:hypothetical protein
MPITLHLAKQAEQLRVRPGMHDSWTDLAALGLILHPFDPIQDGPEVGAMTARLRGRQASDSTYVCLARRLGTAMWTLDGALARHAADFG